MRSIKSYYVANNYMLKVNTRKINIDCEMCLELTISFEIIEVVLVIRPWHVMGYWPRPPSLNKITPQS